MGKFIYYDPQKSMEMADELQPSLNAKEENLIAPEEWTYCEKEGELAKFANRHKEKPED